MQCQCLPSCFLNPPTLVPTCCHAHILSSHSPHPCPLPSPALILESRHLTPSSHAPSIVLLHYWGLVTLCRRHPYLPLPLAPRFSHPILTRPSHSPHASLAPHPPHPLISCALYRLACPPLSSRITLVAWLLMPAFPHPLAASLAQFAPTFLTLALLSPCSPLALLSYCRLLPGMRMFRGFHASVPSQHGAI
jgi:hypothetical protein